MIRRSTIVVIIFGIIVAALVGYNQLVKSQPPLEITVVVDPLAEAWVSQAAKDFNATGTLVNNGTTRVLVIIESKSDVEVWTGKSGWTFNNHPQGWIAASSASLSYIPSNLPFKPLQPSLARTPLVWGGFQNRVNVITKDGQQPFDWATVNNVLKAGTWAAAGATNISGNINMAIYPPKSSMAGLAALISGVADLQQTASLDRSHLTGTAYEDWIDPLSAAVPNIAGFPEVEMASRGTSVADFALLPEARWLLNLNALNRRETVALSYPSYQFILDFPMAYWDDATTTDIQRQAVTAFGTYLTGAPAQQLATTYGLRPADSEPDETATLFNAGVPFGIQLDPSYGTIVNTPARNEADTLLRALD
jgi:hypothetical protein